MVVFRMYSVSLYVYNHLATCILYKNFIQSEVSIAYLITIDTANAFHITDHLWVLRISTLSCCPEQASEETAELPVILDIMTSICRHCNVTIKSKTCA